MPRPVLFAVKARRGVRKSFKDPGRVGIWMVLATSPERAAHA
jgi:hypothetical protein